MNDRFVSYRFIRDFNELRPNGVLIVDPLEVDFWRKKFIWMQWLVSMDDWALELTMIGNQAASRPFHNDYDAARLQKTRTSLAKLVDTCAWRPDRTFLTEETFDTLDVANEVMT